MKNYRQKIPKAFDSNHPREYGLLKKSLLFIMLFLSFWHQISLAQCTCLTNSLIINTGYDPATGLAIPSGVNGGVPVPDPNWKVDFVSNMLNTYAVSSGFLVSTTNANVVVGDPAWVGNLPLTNWISCINSNIYYGPISGTIYYSTHLSREFKLCSAAPATIDIYSANDNWLDSIVVFEVGGPGVWLMPGSGSAPLPEGCCTNYGAFKHRTSTFSLPAGTFKIMVVLREDGGPFNAIGLDIAGTVTTPSNSIVGPSVLPIVGPGIACIGVPTPYTDPTPAGTWSIGPPGTGGATISPTGVVTGISPGTITITYTAVMPCGPATTTKVISIGSSPGTIIGPGVMCENDHITLTETVPGGIWTINPAGIASLFPSGTTAGLVGLSAGTATVTYTVTNACGTSAAYQTILVNALPGVTALALDTMVCSGNCTTLLAASGYPGPIAYLWLPGGATTFSTTVCPTTTTIYTVTVSDPSTSCYSTGTVKVNVVSAGHIDGSLSLCQGTTSALSNTVTGGSWSSSNPTIASISASGVVSGILPGTSIITYSTSSGCITTAIVSVNAIPVISGRNLCSIDSAIFTATIPGGTWNSSNSAVATVDSSTGKVKSVSTGACIITYTSPAGCKDTIAITVSIPNISGGPVCIGQTTMMTTSISSGKWYSGSPGVATVDSVTGLVTGMSLGTSVITYLVGGCAATFTMIVLPPLAISGAGTICTGGTLTLSCPPGGGVWSGGTTGIATINTATGLVTPGATAGTVTFTYTKGSCTATTVVTVIALPVISGGPSCCVGGTISLSSSATGGVWSNGGSAIASVNSAGLVSGSAAGTAIISYTIGLCRSTYIVTINPNPVVTGTHLCVGTTRVGGLTTTIPGGTWATASPLITVGTSTGTITAGMTTGTASVTYAIGTCTATCTVTVDSLPGITGVDSVCAGLTTTFFGTPSGGTWSYTGSVVSVNSSTGVITAGAVAGTALITYSVGLCSVTRTVKVLPLPLISPAGTRVVCNPISLNATPATGTWSGGGGVVYVTNPGGGVGVVHALIRGTAILTYTTLSGCKSTTIVTVDCPCNAMDSVHTTLTTSGHFGDSCTYICSANTTTINGWHVAGYLWQTGSTSVWHGSSATTDTYPVTVPVSGTRIVKVTFYAVDSTGDTCKQIRMDTLTCVHSPCYNAAGTYLTVTTTTDAMGNCVYTAKVKVSTGNIIAGYQWHVSGGITSVVHTSADSSAYTFTLTPGMTTTVFVKVNIVDFYFNAGSSPCCEANLSQYVTCGDTTGISPCHDSAKLVYTNFPEGHISCIFHVTCNAFPAAGRTVAGYIWAVGSSSTSTIWSTAPSNAYPGPITVPAGSAIVVVVTVLTVDGHGDTCRTIQKITLGCGCTCLDAATTTLNSSLNPVCPAGYSCCYTLTANAGLTTSPGCVVVGYLWKINGITTWVPTSATTATRTINLLGGAVSDDSVTIYAVAPGGDTCKIKRGLVLGCGCNCFNEPATTLTFTKTTMGAPNPGCIYHFTATAAFKAQCKLVEVEWHLNNTFVAIGFPPSSSPNTVTNAYVVPAGVTDTLVVIFKAVDANGDTCTTSRTIIFNCGGSNPHTVYGCCFDTLHTTLGSMYAMDIHGNCLYTVNANYTLLPGCTFLGYSWIWPAGVLPSGLVSWGSHPFTLAPGTGINVTVTFVALNSNGDTCKFTRYVVLKCPGNPNPWVVPSVIGCIDPGSSTITISSVPIMEWGCNISCTANPVSLPGWTVYGYGWYTSPLTYFFTTSNTYGLDVPNGASVPVSVVVFSTNEFADTCSDTLHTTLNCNSGDGWAERRIHNSDDSYGVGDMQANSINIYPNPTDNAVTISSEHIWIKNVQVIDVNGKKVGNYSFDDTRSVRIPMEQLVPGTYLFRVNETTSKVVTKVQ